MQNRLVALQIQSNKFSQSSSFRAAQRAFRERKQSQLAELQARVQSYEQGEIERNVALQNVAKRLKDENEALRRENVLLKEKLSKMEDSPPQSAKRWRDDSPSSTSQSNRKRAKVNGNQPEPAPITQISISQAPSPPSMISSPDSSESSGSPFTPMHLDSHPDVAHPMLSNLLDMSNGKSNYPQPQIFTTFDCGFCNDNTPCVCREVVLQQAADQMETSLKLESYDHNTSVINLDADPEPSILDNLPAYQPAVPLRRKGTGTTNPNSIFQVIPLSQPQNDSPANCSGDPNNCLACADDSFGKAFCAAIGKSVAALTSCDDCPCTPEERCTPESSSVRLSNPRSLLPNPPTQISISSSMPSDSDTMPTNTAWQQLKSHPNVSFSDLDLLADVVARRSKCTGPRVVISPAPGSITPERSTSPPPAAASMEAQSVLLTDPHALYHEKERDRSSPPRLVPQEILIRCGQQRIREVQAAGVHDALRLLDAKFS